MKSKQARVYLAHGNDAKRKVVLATIELLGHLVELSTDAPSVLIRRSQENPPDIIIIGADYAGDNIFDVLNELSELQICPVIALLPPNDIERTPVQMADQVMGILVEPLWEEDLRTSIHLARCRFDQAKRLENQIQDLQSRLKGGPTH